MRKQSSHATQWPDANDLLREKPGDRMIRLTPARPGLDDGPALETMLSDGWSVAAREVARQSDGTPGFAAQITLRREGERALVLFTDIAQIPCFTPGTAILTQSGDKPVQHLREGDFVITRDNGLQPVRWLGRRDVGPDVLSLRPHWAPVLICKDALGQGCPDRDIRVSPNHRMLVSCIREDEEGVAAQEVLIAARYLTCLPGISAEPGIAADYVHVLFDRHEVIMANGCWSESFQPDAQSLLGLERTDRRALLTLYPELAEQPRLPEYMPARPCLDRREAVRALARLR